jgi:hypothetical protein
MILAHLIVGLIPVENNFSWFWFLGSIFPDVDHIFIIFKNKIFSLKKLTDTIANEEKYGIKYKTKYLHSVLGGIIISAVVFFVNFSGGIYFFLAYILHLTLDFPDKDEKQYFYPLKLKIKGWLPIFSKTEIIFTAILIIFLIIRYKI